MFALAIALSASTSVSSTLTKPPISPADVRKRVISCGLTTSEVKMRYERELQDDVVTVMTKSAPSTDQYKCIANVAYETGYYVGFEPPFRDQYWPISNSVQKSRSKMESEARLKARGILDKLPRLESVNLSVLAERLETICGIKPRTALIVSHDDFSLRPNGLSGPTAEKDFICLMDALSVAGIRMGFVGNEAATKSGL
jgi:hypothetical protein